MTQPALLFIIFMLIYIGIQSRLCWLDFKHRLLPDSLTYPLLWAGLLYQIMINPGQLTSSVLGAIAGYLSLWLLYWVYFCIRKREGIGYGDMKLLAALGAWHGWQSLQWIALIAACCGLLFAGAMALQRKGGIASSTTPLPFGPCLIIAGGVTGWFRMQLLLPDDVSFLL